MLSIFCHAIPYATYNCVAVVWFQLTVAEFNWLPLTFTRREAQDDEKRLLKEEEAQEELRFKKEQAALKVKYDEERSNLAAQPAPVSRITGRIKD